MQTLRSVIRQIPLHSKVCSSWSSTSRTFFTCPVWNKSTKHPELTEDPALSTKSETSKDLETSNDPGLQKERLRQYQNAWRRNKYHTNPIWREQYLAQKSIYERTRRATNVEWRGHRIEYNKKYHALRKDKIPHFAVAKALRTWVYCIPLLRERLFWSTHMPILTQEKVENRCASCGVKRRGGAKLFWQRHQESEDDKHLLDCTGCFFKDPATFLPEGFEDVKTVEQLQKRKEQLMGVKARKPRRKTASPPPST